MLKNIYMFTNQYYINYIVAEKLFESKRHSTGTILTNRKELPNLIKKKKKSKFQKKSMIALKQLRKSTGKHNEKINHKGSMTFFPNINNKLLRRKEINPHIQFAQPKKVF